MARPKAEKAPQTIAEIEAQIAQLKEQVEQKRQAQLVKAGELLKKLHDKGALPPELEAEAAKIFKG